MHGAVGKLCHSIAHLSTPRSTGWNWLFALGPHAGAGHHDPAVVLYVFQSVLFLRLVAENAPIDVQSLAFFRLRMVGCLFQCLIFVLRGFYSAYRNNRIFFSVIALSLIIHCLS